MAFVFYIFLFVINFCHAKDLFTINFIKAYIANENKPTDLNFEYFGWPKHLKIKLIKDISYPNLRSSNWSPSGRDTSTLFVADLNFTDVQVFLNITQYFRSPYRWLLLLDDVDEEVLKVLCSLPLLVDSDVVLAQRNGSIFTMTEIYKPSPSGSMSFVLRGHYNGSFTETRQRREMFRRRANLLGHSLIVSNVILDNNSSIYHLLQEDRLELESDLIAKMSWRVIRLALEMMNATAEPVFTYDEGHKGAEGWSGMFGDLKAGRVDLGTTSAMDVDRLEVSVFTDSIVPVQTMFIFRQPPLSYVSNIYTLPFSMDVWVAVVVSTLIAMVTIYLCSKLEARNLKHVTQLDGKVSDAVFFTLSAISQQGCSLEPMRASGRIMTFLLFISMTAVYAAYSANIVVLLQSPSTAINTLAELAQSKMTLAALDADYNRKALMEANDPIRKEIHKKVSFQYGNAQFYNLEDGVKRLKQGLFAFHAVLEPVYRRIENTFTDPEKCDLMEVDFMNAYDHHAPIQKSSPYIELLRVSFKRMREVGIRTALEKRYKTPKPKCIGDAVFSSVGIENVKPLLFIVLYAVAASILILFIEIVVHKLTTQRLNI